MTRYAAGTSVPVDRSRAEIERTLQRYGATSFMYGWQGSQAAIGFVMHDRQIRLLLPLPDPEARKYVYKQANSYAKRAASERQRLYDQDVRQCWRALLLVVKAKLEAVEARIVSFEQEFAMHMVLPGGQTVAEQVLPRIADAYETGTVPDLLPVQRPALTGGTE